MLYESDVINAVCEKLESLGYSIQQKLDTNQKGDDIVAIRHGEKTRKILIEAKGETSSRKNSERFGNRFDGAQVKVHVAEALYKAVQVISSLEENDLETIVGIALPDSDYHINSIKKIQPV